MDVRNVASKLKEQNNILLLTHRRPDGDTLGSATALCLGLRQLGKTAYLSPNPEAHGLFAPYLEGQFAPASFTPEFVVAVDIATPQLFPDNVKDMAVDLVVDHHGSNSDYGTENFVDASAAACGELVYAILMELGTMSKEIAQRLYVAISTDTGCFAYSNTTPTTHRITAHLMEVGADFAWANKRHFRTKTYKRLKLESMMAGDMALYHGGKTAVVAVTLNMMASLQATEEDAEDISAFVGQVEGVENGITIRELAGNRCKLSLRTGEDLDASKVCALLGGGGHRAAAGCTVTGTVEEAKAAIVAAIEKIW